ncbi:sulfate ABC transporter permease subunit CysW [Verrucomicrobia bacterium LW23]|nr:sulfate ABC transporter permease subunit CysW [Verrucomicrobia bacterium LW23]
MATSATTLEPAPPQEAPRRRRIPRKATTEPLWVRLLLITIAVGFIAGFLLMPLFIIFKESLLKGIRVYYDALENPHAVSAIKLTLLTAAIVVPLNTLFGVAAAWAISRFSFPGKRALVTLIDLPLWVSPIVAGLMFVILFGRQGLLNSLFWSGGKQVFPILFEPAGIVIATLFVTFPFVARILIPLMQAQGSAEEEAALTLGARGWQTFVYITLPKIKWGLFYGIILCNARAIGEFGAVSAVSGHIQGLTNTIPLHIELMYNSSQMEAAFALASILSMLALLTLVLKSFFGWQAERQAKEALESTP